MHAQVYIDNSANLIHILKWYIIPLIQQVIQCVNNILSQYTY